LREAVNPVLTVAVRYQQIAVRGLFRPRWHVEGGARLARLALRAERHQHFAGRRMLRDRVEAGVADEDLVVAVDPDPVRRREDVAPVRVLGSIRVEHQDVPDAGQNVADAATLGDVADADVGPPGRIEGDVGGDALDLNLGPALHDLELVAFDAEPPWHGLLRFHVARPARPGFCCHDIATHRRAYAAPWYWLAQRRVSD